MIRAFYDCGEAISVAIILLFLSSSPPSPCRSGRERRRRRRCWHRMGRMFILVILHWSCGHKVSLVFYVYISTTIDQTTNDCNHSYSQADHIMIRIQRCSTTQHTPSSGDALSRVDRTIRFVRQLLTSLLITYLYANQKTDVPHRQGTLPIGILDRLLVSIPWPCRLASKSWYERSHKRSVKRGTLLEERMAAPYHLAHWIILLWVFLNLLWPLMKR